MPAYTFYLRNKDGVAAHFERRDLAFDSDTYPTAGALLDEYDSCAYVEVWRDDTPVLERHREAPHIRQVDVVSISERSAR